MTKTTKTILIVGGVAVAVYLLTRPKTYPTQQAIYPGGVNPYANPYANPYGTTQPGVNPNLITAGANAINSLIPAITKLFGGGSTAAPVTPATNNLPSGYFGI